jgi:hypothetical protein
MSRKPRRSGVKTRHSYSDYRRLSPSELRARDESPKARRYVLKSVKGLTKRTPTISARTHETMRTREETGLASPEIATKARQSSALMYKSEQARVTASHNKDLAFVKRVRARIDVDVAAGKRIQERNADGSVKTTRRRAASYRLRSDAAAHYFELRRRKLAGEWIDDGDWHWLADMAGEYEDPRGDAMRAYPPSYGVRDAAA